MVRGSTTPTARFAAVGLLVLIIAVLHVAREVLVPIALALLLSFVLAPAVRQVERLRVGRLTAVLAVALLAFGVVAGVGAVVTTQVIDLADNLPEYKDNLQDRIRALRSTEPGTLSRAGDTLRELGEELAGAPAGGEDGAATTPERPNDADAPAAALAQPPTPVRVVEPPPHPLATLRDVLTPLLAPLATAGIVIVLVIAFLLQRENLRDRVIQLIGPEQINVTTQALDDAGRRVSRYLLMQLIANGSNGIVVAIGLWLIGVPNALLWGLLGGALRFIPYVGAWIAAALPLTVSLATTTGWTQPLLVLGLILTVELVSNNIVEPLLYGSSTGVSAVAVLMAAIFWTWLWGPVGLLLATPLTVCVVVMGRHVPQLRFLTTLLAADSSLPPEAAVYQRLLALDLDGARRVIDAAAKDRPLAEIYDTVLIPALRLAEHDRHRGELDEERALSVTQGMSGVLEELQGAAEDRPPGEGGVVIVPAHDEADALAGQMLASALREHVSARMLRPMRSKDLLSQALSHKPSVVCVSALPPVAVGHARMLAKQLKAQAPEVTIMIGLWNEHWDAARVRQLVRTPAADEVSATVVAAVDGIAALLAPVDAPMQPGAMPDDEAQRLEELKRLNLLDTPPEEVFDRFTRRLADIFEAPISLMTLVDEERQWWKSHVGLPQDLAAARATERELSVCGHVVAQNELLVVEDLLKDPRFANNPLIRRTGIRFYAGAPLRAESGRSMGSLCVIDTKPRQLTEREKKLLQMVADDVIREVRMRELSAKVAEVSRQLEEQHRLATGDLERAKAVQQCLLPPPTLEGEAFQVCQLYRAAGQVGGDFIDVMPRRDGSVVIILADAAGRGTSAALVAVLMKATFVRVAARVTRPHELLDAIQQDLRTVIQPGRFATAVAAVLDPRSGALEIATAGHHAPILIRDRSAQVLERTDDPALLADPEHRFAASHAVRLGPGDRVLFSTDGAVEVAGSDGELLGVKGLARLIEQTEFSRGAGFLTALLDSIQARAAGDLEDDVALICIEQRAAPAQLPDPEPVVTPRAAEAPTPGFTHAASAAKPET